MARFASLALVVLAVIAVGSVAYEADLSHDFLEVDPLMNEYAQLAEQGIAFTELGADVFETEAEHEEAVDADADAEEESEEDAPKPAAAPATPAPVAAAPAVAAPAANKTAAPAAAPVANKTAAPAPAAPAAPATPAPAAVPVASLKGWAFKEAGAPESVNITDAFAFAYDNLKTKAWGVANITERLPVKEYTYVIVGGTPGTGRRAEYMAPVKDALAALGVAKEAIQVPNLPVAVSAVENAKTLFDAINSTFHNVNLEEQKIVLIAHSNAILTIHAMVSVYPAVTPMIQGVIALNPTWGGAAIATNFASLPKDVAAVAQAIGIKAAHIGEMTYKNRQELVRSFPIDYNGLRLLVVATHNEKPAGRYVATAKYVTEQSKEINDGIVALSDQVIPGARAVILAGLDHDALAFKPAAGAAFDPVLAAQSYIYTFFKVTP